MAVDAPADLAGHVPLASETRPGDWDDWLAAAAAGLPRRTGRRQVFDHFFVTLQALEDGLGLGIGPFPVLDLAAAARRLATPVPEIGVPRPGYFALTPYDADKTPTLAAFVDWLVADGDPATARP